MDGWSTFRPYTRLLVRQNPALMIVIYKSYGVFIETLDRSRSQEVLTKISKSAGNYYPGYTAKKMDFSLRIFSVNVTKSAVSCGFGPYFSWETLFFVKYLEVSLPSWNCSNKTIRNADPSK